MSQIVNLTIANGDTTPVNKTFEVGNAQMGSTTPATWYEKTGGTFSSFQKATMLVRRSGSAKSTKVSFKVTVPGTDANGVLYNVIGTAEFTLPDSCTLADRKNIRAYVANLLDQSLAQTAVIDMSPAF